MLFRSLQLSIGGMFFGLLLGFILALMRMSSVLPVRWLARCYISIFRGTPLYVQLLVFYSGMYTLEIVKGTELLNAFFRSGLNCTVLALTLNTSAFNAEIWRNAFRTFPREQREAAESVGMRRWAYFRYIMLPQMWIESLPALVNEMSFLIKGSPAIAVIGVVDLTRVTNRISSVTYEPLSPILAAGLLYVVIIGLLLKLQGMAERKAKRLAR